MDTSIKEDDKPQTFYPPVAGPITDLPLEPIQETSQISTIDYELPPKKKKRKAVRQDSTCSVAPLIYTHMYMYMYIYVC